MELLKQSLGTFERRCARNEGKYLGFENISIDTAPAAEVSQKHIHVTIFVISSLWARKRTSSCQGTFRQTWSQRGSRRWCPLITAIIITPTISFPPSAICQTKRRRKTSHESNLPLTHDDVRGCANFWDLGCVNPASWLSLAAGTEFTQPRAHAFG